MSYWSFMAAHEHCGRGESSLLEYLKTQLPEDGAEKEYDRRIDTAKAMSESENYCPWCDSLG